MKAQELMIGDWIKNPLGLKVRVSAIHHYSPDVDEDWEDYYVVVCEFGKGSWQRMYVKDVQPIPLTPEILEKNGFHWGCTASEEDFCAAVGCGYPDSGWCFDEGAGEIKILFPNETDGGLVRLDDQNGDRYFELVFVDLLMVHELQHALRLCGIEKEIVL